MIKGIISTGSYIIKLLINIYEKFYKSTAAVREEVYIGVFHRKILIFAWMFSRINSVILGGINMSEITVIALVKFAKNYYISWKIVTKKV